MSLSIFPAKMTMMDTGIVVQKSHVRMQDNRIQVWIANNAYPHTPLLMIDDFIAREIKEWNQWAPKHERFAEFVLDSGETIKVERANGCGCGDRLRTIPQWVAKERRPELSLF